VSQLGDICAVRPRLVAIHPCDIGHRRLSMRETRRHSHTDPLEGHLSVRKTRTGSQKEGLRVWQKDVSHKP
jgi:hypothetical protein